MSLPAAKINDEQQPVFSSRWTSFRLDSSLSSKLLFLEMQQVSCLFGSVVLQEETQVPRSENLYCVAVKLEHAFMSYFFPATFNTKLVKKLFYCVDSMLTLYRIAFRSGAKKHLPDTECTTFRSWAKQHLSVAIIPLKIAFLKVRDIGVFSRR